MTAIAEERETKTAADQLRLVADWLDGHDCQTFGVYTTNTGIPQVYFLGIEDLKRIFAGMTATKKRDGSRFIYSLVVDGIQFQASKWPEPEIRDCEPVDVTL